MSNKVEMDGSMAKQKSIGMEKIGMKGHFLILAACWSLLMLLAMAYQMKHTRIDSISMAIIQAKVAFDKDIAYRKWGADKGGVYGRVTDDTPPNLYLQVKERDIVTPSGQELTLINPAYMTRQVQEWERQQKGVLSHLTSLKPIRPQNSPDPWERTALLEFEKGATEFSSLESIDGKQYMRFMKPFITAEGCLKCHARQGYKIGDIRGGISTSVPMDSIYKIEQARLKDNFIVYFFLWLLGMIMVGIGTFRLNGQLVKRKKIEAELDNFKTTLDKTRDCIFMFDPVSLKIFYVNQGALLNVGYSKEELLSMTPVDIKPDFTEQSFREKLQPLLDGEESSITFETIHWHKDGFAIPVEITLQYVVPGEGKGRFVAFVRDITDRKKAEEEKEKIQIRLLQLQKLESVGQLAAGIAHEINTPTQYVGTNIDFLKDTCQDVDELMGSFQRLLTAEKNHNVTPEIVEHVENTLDKVDWDYLAEEIPAAIIQSRVGIDQVSKIVRAMKEFSHPGSNEKVPANLNGLIENTVIVSSNEWKYVADMQLKLDPDLPSVSCLIDEMGQVFLNIIVNAAHALAEKFGDNPVDERGSITITSQQAGDWIEVSVQDNGMGMADIVQVKIFDPFFTTKEVGKGSGQGMTIVYDVVVEKHGGQIIVDSDLGQGTIVTVRLPIDGNGDKANASSGNGE